MGSYRATYKSSLLNAAVSVLQQVNMDHSTSMLADQVTRRAPGPAKAHLLGIDTSHRHMCTGFELPATLRTK